MSDTWSVTIQQGHRCTFEVEARDREEAIEKAKRQWDRGDYYSGRYEPLGTGIAECHNLGPMAKEEGA